MVTRFFHVLYLGLFLFIFSGPSFAQFSDVDALLSSLPGQSTEADAALVNGLMSKFPPPNEDVRNRLNIHSPEETKLYFNAHVERTRVLVDLAQEKYLLDAYEHFEIPKYLRNNERIKELIKLVARGHDITKQKALASEGLYRLLGVDIRGLENVQQKEAAMKFIDWINKHDDDFAALVLNGEDARVKKLVLFFEKVGDLVDRTTSAEAAIELGMKKMTKVSTLPEESLKRMIRTDNPKDVEFFRKIAGTVENEVPTLTKNMSYRAQLLARKQCARKAFSVLSQAVGDTF